MITTSNSCVECNQIITNPICAECLADRMRIMIHEYNPKLAREIVGCNISGDTHCLFCGKGMALCAYCFSRGIYDFLEEKNPELAQEFASRFDFELRQELI